MTALQKLIEIMNHMIESGDDNLLPLRIYAVNLLEKEKEQIIDAFDKGMHNGEDYEFFRLISTGEQYYDETYKQ